MGFRLIYVSSLLLALQDALCILLAHCSSSFASLASHVHFLFYLGLHLTIDEYWTHFSICISRTCSLHKLTFSLPLDHDWTLASLRNRTGPGGHCDHWERERRLCFLGQFRPKTTGWLGIALQLCSLHFFIITDRSDKRFKEVWVPNVHTTFTCWLRMSLRLYLKAKTWPF